MQKIWKYVAWLRTSLAFASIGVAVTQFFRLSTTNSDGNPAIVVLGSSSSPSELKRLSSALGGLFVGMGMIIMLFGLLRYFTTQHYLQSNKFLVARATIFFAFLATFALLHLAFLSMSLQANQHS